MKSFLLMSAAWLSGAGGDATLPPAPAPIAHPAPIVGTAPTGACCGNTATPAAPTYHPAPTFTPPAIQSVVVSGGISGSCGCDPCAQATPEAAPAPAPRHLFHRLFGKKPAAPAAAPAQAACGCETAPVVGGSCGCGTPTTATPAPAPSGGLFSRFFGSRTTPAPAPIYSGTISSTPTCNCGQPHLHGGAPVTGVIHGHAPYPQPVVQPGIIQPGATLPSVGTPPTTPAVETPMTPATPLPTGPEKIKESPKEPMKLPSVGEKGLQPASGTRIESGGRLPFDHHHRQQARADRAADFSWVTGKLTYVHVDGGLWILRYAPLDTTDGNGGNIVLSSDRRLESYRDGDLVTVQGRLTVENASTRLAAPLYHMTSIQLVERPSN